MFASIATAAFLASVTQIAPTARCDLASEAAELRDFKTRRWPAAYAEAKVADLERLLAPEFQMIDADGTVSRRQAEIDYVARKAPDPPGRTFTYTIERLEVFENCTAIVSGHGRVVLRIVGSEPSVSTYSSSNVFIKRDGRWLAIASHVSGVHPQTTTP